MKEAKVLIYDLETGGVNALKADLGFVLCCGYKWLGDDHKAKVMRLDQYDGFKPGAYDDRKLLTAFRDKVDEADLLVAHYGDYFDRKFLNGRLLINGLPPIPATKQIDTCRLAWKYFNFSSNRLKHLAERLGCENRKSESKFPDWWLAVLAGDMNALRKMADYCKQDVLTLEEVYLKMRSFLATDHVWLGEDRGACKVCGGKVQHRGFERTKQRKYQRYQCTVCGSWGRESKTA